MSKLKQQNVVLKWIGYSAMAGWLLSGLGCMNGGTYIDNDEHQWISLFNGKNLNGWTPKFSGHELGDNYKDTFQVENGILRVDYSQYENFDGKFGHLFYEKEFSNYDLRVEYRFVGAQVPGGPGWAFRNNGIMLHGQSAETMRLDQDFPVSIEVQMLGGGGTGERPTGNLCTPGTHVVMNEELVKRHCTNSNSITIQDDQWVTLEIEVRGGKTITHKIDGQTVLEYQQPQLDPNDQDARAWLEKRNGDWLLTGGTISIQAESHPTEFRKIEILILDDSAGDGWMAHSSTK